jgi:Predicted integral membrane protein
MGGGAITAAIVLAAIAWFSLPRAPHGVSQSAEPAKPIASSAIPVIAVLPFANQTGAESQEYFADGVTGEVINALGRFNTLRVIGRNAVLPYKKRPATREEVVSELGANYLVGGSVRHSGTRVRIAAELTESRGGTVIWTDRFDGELHRYFRVSGHDRPSDRRHPRRQCHTDRRPAAARSPEAQSDGL